MKEMMVRNGCGLGILHTKTKNVNRLSASLEKLSSGYQINRSADDAAGLAISEKLRLKITGLNRAVENSREGVNLIQVGEGALQEVHDMLNRMAALAEQSANGTYSDTLDREALQRELTQLCQEVDRISESTVYGEINLFQNKGAEYEYAADGKGTVQNAAGMTLRDVVQNTKPDEVSIVYIEDRFTANMKPSGGSSGADGVNDPVVGDTGKRLSQILKEQIVPQCVTNILNTYTCFSYLKGSTLGIGLNLYNNPSDGASASVTLSALGLQTDGTLSTNGYLGFKLSVNVGNSVQPLLGRLNSSDSATVQKARAELEATIAHEMVHAFMDEATTAGMLGADSFPGWFKEGMANTASGPTGWVHKSAYDTGLKIAEDSSDEDILNQIKKHPLNDNASVNKYGTGYLACMYLGAKIAGYTTGTVNASDISRGLSRLLDAVISGSSLDTAVNSLAGFDDTADFVSKFNAGNCPDMFEFARQMQKSRGDGMGGIVTGNLAATDVAADTDIITSLFQLDTTSQTVQNYYPAGYIVGSGGTTGASGKAPTDYGADYGDFLVQGDLSGITFSGDTLTIRGSGNVTIKMKNEATATTQKIVVDGGTVTLEGVHTTGDVTIQGSAQINTAGKNKIGTLTMQSGVSLTLDGKGQLKTTGITGTSGNHLTLNGGAVIVGNGTGAIDSGIGVTVNHAASLASGLRAVTSRKPYEIDWTKLAKMQTLASITLDGYQSGLVLDKDESGKLWLDPGTVHSLTFTGTDAAGASVSRTELITWDDTASQWQAVRPFTVTGGTEGTDYEYGEDGVTLLIKSNAAMTISGGKITNLAGSDYYGRIVVDSGVNANLTLDSVEIDATKIGGNTAGIEIKGESDVTLTMKGTNTIIGNGAAAAIQAGTNTAEKTLAIDMTAGSKLNVTGGKLDEYSGGGAGIGAAAGVNASKTNLLITGSGTIDAKGGGGAAGIGAAQYNGIGNITIDGNASGPLTIMAFGGEHGAGIGAAWSSSGSAGDILIKGAVDITADSVEHATGIGGGCSGVVGDITIGEAGADNSRIKIKASGGMYGAGIGAGWNGVAGDITIHGGDITAAGGQSGAGIGTGYNGSQKAGAGITINGGTITAQGDKSASGIGNGASGTINYVTINGGTITAKGGWTNDGGNIGGYSDRTGKNFAPVTIKDPNGLTIKAGNSGEGKYIAVGAKDADGNELHAFSLDYLNELLGTYTGASLSVDAPGADGASLSYPLKLKATLTDGTVYAWNNVNHMGQNGAYIWAKAGNDMTLEFEDQDGTKGTVTLKYFDEYGMWRVQDETDFPPKPQLPVQKPDPVNPPENPDQPDPPDTPSTPSGGGGGGGIPIKKRQPALGAIILQIGENAGETLAVPRFYFSTEALELDDADVSTQATAWKTMGLVRSAVNRVSDMRGTYGALTNRLDHNINNLTNAEIQASDTESQIRDVDMAREMMKYTRANILNETSQAMLAQCSQISQGVLRFLQ